MKKIAVFGSGRVKEDTNLYQASEKLGRELVEAGYAVVTGGDLVSCLLVIKGHYQQKRNRSSIYCPGNLSSL